MKKLKKPRHLDLSLTAERTRQRLKRLLERRDLVADSRVELEAARERLDMFVVMLDEVLEVIDETILELGSKR